MKKILSLLVVLLGYVNMFGASTTYTFTSLKWNSSVGVVKCDGKTDGWVSILDASEYMEGRNDAQNRLYSRGVGVKKGTTGAGAVSVLEFEKVRKIVINYCQNASKGKGAINVKVGDESKSINVERPEENGTGVYNRDVELDFGEQSGKITFTVDCKENGIYINTITIKADNGSPNNPSISENVYRLVTSPSELRDGDKVMFGVAKNDANYVLGLYDENFSKNNISAVSAVYESDRQSVREKEEAVYVVEKYDDAFAFVDAYGWYLTATGGNPTKGTNNYLTVWDDIQSDYYGDFGLWNISIDAEGKACVENCGWSRSKYMQFNANASNAHPVFSCYENMNFTSVALYRKQDSVDVKKPFIDAHLVNFGEVVLDEEVAAGQKTVEVTAMNLKDEFTAELMRGESFSIDKNILDKDGDKIVVSYSVTEPGEYADSLILKSGRNVFKVGIYLKVLKRMNIAEVINAPEQTVCYLTPVKVNKKYSTYIFVEDESGAMLLYDNGNGYGKDVKNGDILSNVSGTKRDYYGNPELSLSAKFSAVNAEPNSPTIKDELFTQDDLCRFVRYENVHGTDNATSVKLGDEEIAMHDLFNVISGKKFKSEFDYNVEGIVYNYNGLVLCPTSIELIIPEGVEISTLSKEGNDEGGYDLNGMIKSVGDYGVIVTKGKKYLVK